jgi:hypothetical protein
MAGMHEHEHQMCANRFVWDSGVVSGADTTVKVLPNMFCAGNGIVYSDSSMVSLEDHLGDTLMKDKTVKHKDTSEENCNEGDDLTDRFPFLKRYIEGGPIDAKGSHHKDADSGDDDIADTQVLDDDEMEAVFAALQKKRQEWSVDYNKPVEHFKTCILGGPWTQVHRGTSLADVRAFAAGSKPVAWCKKYFGVQQSSYSYRKYGDAVASSLALYWTHRMEHFYQIYLDANDDGYQYTDDDLASAPNPDVVSAALQHAGDKAAQGHKRLTELVESIPRTSSSSCSSR